MMKTITTLLMLFVFASCVSGPETVPDKGAVYGTISAKSHKDIIAKASKSNDGMYGENGEIIFTKQMVNYNNLNELFVCLLSPTFKGGNEHSLIVRDGAMSKRSLAVGVGDRLSIENKSSKTLTFFIAGKGDDIQSYSPIKPGGKGSVVIKLDGNLELGSDENEALVISLLSRKGLISQQHKSGDEYTYKNLYPGQYKIIFWFWRLGFVEKSIVIKAGENIELNQILSVDKVLGNRNDT